MGIVKDIYDFNDQAGFLGKGMDSFLEMSFILEEVFEQFEGVYNTYNANGEPFKPGDPEYPTATQLGTSLANSIKDNMERRGLEMPSPVNELDRAIDIAVYSIGKIAKMGLTPEQIARAFKVVSDCNMAKLTGLKDELGKQLKPEGWEGPEAKLQEILNERKEDNAVNAET